MEIWYHKHFIKLSRGNSILYTQLFSIEKQYTLYLDALRVPPVY